MAPPPRAKGQPLDVFSNVAQITDLNAHHELDNKYNPGRERRRDYGNEGTGDWSRRADGFSRNESRGGFGRDTGYGRDREGGFSRDRDSGFSRDREGGFNRDREGGFNRDRDGGFNRDRDGGFNRDRDGGFNRDRDSGFGRDREGGFGRDKDSGYGFNRGQSRAEEEPGRSWRRGPAATPNAASATTTATAAPKRINFKSVLDTAGVTQTVSKATEEKETKGIAVSSTSSRSSVGGAGPAVSTSNRFAELDTRLQRTDTLKHGVKEAPGPRTILSSTSIGRAGGSRWESASLASKPPVQQAAGAPRTLPPRNLDALLQDSGRPAGATSSEAYWEKNREREMRERELMLQKRKAEEEEAMRAQQEKDARLQAEKEEKERHEKEEREKLERQRAERQEKIDEERRRKALLSKMYSGGHLEGSSSDISAAAELFARVYAEGPEAAPAAVTELFTRAEVLKASSLPVAVAVALLIRKVLDLCQQISEEAACDVAEVVNHRVRPEAHKYAPHCKGLIVAIREQSELPEQFFSLILMQSISRVVAGCGLGHLSETDHMIPLIYEALSQAQVYTEEDLNGWIACKEDTCEHRIDTLARVVKMAKKSADPVPAAQEVEEDEDEDDFD